MEEKIGALGGFQTEGLFRLPGNKTVFDGLRDRTNEGRGLAVEGAHANDIGSLYKLWLRMVPGRLFDQMTALSLLERTDYVAIADRLPVLERNVLKHLIGFLRFAATFSAVTKMDTGNLGMVFGPNILADLPTGTDQKRMSDCWNAGKLLIIALINEWDVTECYPLSVPGGNRREPV
jgi:hypothetical protein